MPPLNFIDYETTEGGDPVARGAGSGEGGDGQGASSASPPAETFSISKEEWEATQRNLAAMAQIITNAWEDDDSTPPSESTPPPATTTVPPEVREYVDSRFGTLAPHVERQVADQGRKVMLDAFAELKKDESIGDFDDNLAERVANSFFAETGDPELSVQEAARYAAKIRKQEREEGQSELKKNLRGYHDEPEGAGAASSRPRHKSYDEVIDAWSGQAEVG